MQDAQELQLRTDLFFSLTPEQVLEAVEQSGRYTTGLCYPLNSLENRVYEVELEDGERLIAKFYRPGRWHREAILDEHRLLAALNEHEIPTCAPRCFDDGDTLRATPAGIFFALFPKVGGRSPDELDLEKYTDLGRLLGRIHNVSASLQLEHRPALVPATYGNDSLATILARTDLPPGLKQRFTSAAEALIEHAERLYNDVPLFTLHADCHRGNLLHGPSGWFFLDFDDSVRGPAVQDLWLLLPSRLVDCPRELETMLAGYEEFRDFPHSSLRLVEALRGLRYLRYAAWVARRWDDPSFPRAFPHWGTEGYWEGQTADLLEQVHVLEAGPD